MRAIVVTGASGGLGPTVLARLERDYRCITISHKQADLANEADVRRVLADAGEVYGVVHLVGGFDTDANAWSKMMTLNYTTAVNVFRGARIGDGGRAIAISSYATLTKPAGLGPYVASKSALNGLVQTLASEWRKRRITANALLPDDLSSTAMREHVAETIAFLLSDNAANITGALIPMVA